MSTIDLSRDATDPRKRYAGVRMQQGRVLTDDDFNEAAVLDAEEMRRTRLDAIGAYGAGALFGGIPGGLAAARFGPKRAVVGGLVLLSLASFGFALVSVCRAAPRPTVRVSGPSVSANVAAAASGNGRPTVPAGRPAAGVS